MRYPKCVVLAICGLLAGCAASPVGPEATREVVLQYLNGEGGTAGPFSKQAKKELTVLAPADRAQASELIDRGAVVFLVYEKGTASATRVILVAKERVVGDFRASQPPPAANGPSPSR